MFSFLLFGLLDWLACIDNGNNCAMINDLLNPYGIEAGSTFLYIPGLFFHLLQTSRICAYTCGVSTF